MLQCCPTGSFAIDKLGAQMLQAAALSCPAAASDPEDT